MVTGRMGLSPILPVKLPVTISTTLNFDGHYPRDIAAKPRKFHEDEELPPVLQFAYCTVQSPEIVKARRYDVTNQNDDNLVALDFEGAKLVDFSFRFV